MYVSRPFTASLNSVFGFYLVNNISKVEKNPGNVVNKINIHMRLILPDCHENTIIVKMILICSISKIKV